MFISILVGIIILLVNTSKNEIKVDILKFF